MIERKENFRLADSGISDANYLFMNLVGDRGKGEAPSLPMVDGCGFALCEFPDSGKVLVLNCPSYPKLQESQGFTDGFEGMDTMGMIEEMHLNGLGHKIGFSDHAYIRVFDKKGKAEPVVFRDYLDAVAYVEKSL
jgi:hypothetical protein